MMASVSSAGWESRGGRALTPTSAMIHGANSGWLTNCQAAGHAGQPVAALRGFVVLLQFLQRGDDRLFLRFLERLGFVAMLGGGGEQIRAVPLGSAAFGPKTKSLPI